MEEMLTILTERPIVVSFQTYVSECRVFPRGCVFTCESRGPSVKTLQFNMELCHFSQTKYDNIYKKNPP